MVRYPDIFDNSNTVFIAGLPKLFNFCKSIEYATKVYIVSAFVHRSGWGLIRPSLIKSNASLKMITGFDFCQSEPSVLKDWIGSQFHRKGAKAFIYAAGNIFHPKMFIVKSPSISFALVGSGNLSAGGLRNNVECFVYVHDKNVVKEIEEWFQSFVDDKEKCLPLTREDISDYERKYKKASSSRKVLQNIAKEANAKLIRSYKARMAKWNQAISEAKHYFRSSDFNWHKGQLSAAKKILRLLDYPSFDFDYQAWSKFYDIRYMGHLNPINKNRVFLKRTRLPKALKTLSNKSLPIVDRVNSILDPQSSSYISYFGINTASKILASLEPKHWPVLNGPVMQTLKSFGYKSPRGISIGYEYLAFAELMMEFLKASNAKDMLALDCFFYWKYEKTKH